MFGRRGRKIDEKKGKRREIQKEQNIPNYSFSGPK